MGIWLMAGIFDRAVGLGLLRNTPICTLYTGCRSLRAVVPCGPGSLGAAETFSECALSSAFCCAAWGGFWKAPATMSAGGLASPLCMAGYLGRTTPCWARKRVYVVVDVALPR